MIQINGLVIIGEVVLLLVICAILYFYYQRLVKQKNEVINLLQEKNESILLAQDELKHAKEKAEESDKLKSSFLANMSHEIRTPLNAIMGFSSLLLQANPDEEEKKEYVEIIHNNSNKLLDLMDEVFNIALIESGITKMYKEDCPVNELLASLITHFNLEKEQLEKNNVNIRIRRSSKDNSFSLFTDPRKLRQTLYNLIENALKYTDEGSIEIGYELTDNSMVEFYVKDTGIGFPQEKLDVVFQRFRQADDSNTRQYGGIGLGLTLSQKFVEMMGGYMHAESQPGVGSVFYFSIPYQSKENFIK